MTDDEDGDGDEVSKLGREILSDLTPREAKVLRERFGIDMSQEHSLEDVGKQFEITRKRIKGIEEKALRKLQGKQAENKSGIQCSFCGKFESEVKRLIKADTGVTICNECLQICSEIIKDNTDK